jgi:hypothetical protein
MISITARGLANLHLLLVLLQGVRVIHDCDRVMIFARVSRVLTEGILDDVFSLPGDVFNLGFAGQIDRKEVTSIDIVSPFLRKRRCHD